MASVLLVDDRSEERAYLESLLRYRGHRTMAAGDGAEALELARTTHPDLVITDILLSSMDGSEFVTRLRRETATPVLFYTMSYHRAEAERLARLGNPARVLTEPCDPEAILGAVTEMLGEPDDTIPSLLPATLRERRYRALSRQLGETLDHLDVTSQRLTALIEATRGLSAKATPEELRDRFADIARRLMGARYAVVALRSPDSDVHRTSVRGLPPEGADSIRFTFPRRGPMARILAGKSSTRATGVTDPEALGLGATHTALASLVVARIGPAEAPLGIVYAADKLCAAEFSDLDEYVLSMLAEQAAAAYDRAVLAAAADARLKQQRMVTQLGLRALELHGTGSFLAEAVERVMVAMDVDVVELFELLPAEQRLISRAATGWTDGIPRAASLALGRASHAGFTLFARDVVLVPDLAAETRFTVPPALVAHGLVSSACVPVHGPVAGVLAVHTRRRRMYSSFEVQTLSAVASVLAAFDTNRRLEERLRQAERTEAIGQLAGGVAHEFNNLLTVVSGYAHLLLDNPDMQNGSREAVGEICKASGRAAELTHQLLAYGRRQVMRPRLVSLNPLLLQLRGVLQRITGPRVELVMSLGPDAGLVEIDPEQLEQALLNLAANARDAMPHGGRVTILTQRVALDAAAAAARPGLATGDYVMLAVSDTGRGMDARAVEHAFEPFYSTKDRGPSAGLGLPAVQGIIHQSGGHVRLESEPARGTRVELLLPRRTAGLEMVSGAMRMDAPRGETVLLCEDEPALRRLASHILREAGFLVVEAGDVASAVTMSRTRGSRVHALVTDVMWDPLESTCRHASLSIL